MVATYNWFINNVQDDEVWAWRSTLTKEQCDSIIKYGLSLESQDAHTNQSDSVNVSIRNSRISWIPSNNPETQWIFQTCAYMVNEMNAKYFNYDLLYLESLQFTQYSGDDLAFYGKHTDTAFKSHIPRKLSFSILLSDETTFDGGDLLLHCVNEPMTAPKTQGTAVVFPSFTLHEVTPVTKGTRYSLVGWVVGPRFK